jgi:hypothetical protein
MTRREGSLLVRIADLSQSAADATAPKRQRAASRIMYIERKAGELTGSARIGRVNFSRTGRTLYYRDQTFQSLKGQGYKANFFELSTGDTFWISGPKRDGSDRLYGERVAVEIDDDVREEYWSDIRSLPHCAERTTA